MEISIGDVFKFNDALLVCIKKEYVKEKYIRLDVEDERRSEICYFIDFNNSVTNQYPVIFNLDMEKDIDTAKKLTPVDLSKEQLKHICNNLKVIKSITEDAYDDICKANAAMLKVEKEKTPMAVSSVYGVFEGTAFQKLTDEEIEDIMGPVYDRAVELSQEVNDLSDETLERIADELKRVIIKNVPNKRKLEGIIVNTKELKKTMEDIITNILDEEEETGEEYDG